jgi:hypothetical protein
MSAECSHMSFNLYLVANLPTVWFWVCQIGHAFQHWWLVQLHFWVCNGWLLVGAGPCNPTYQSGTHIYGTPIF